MVIKFKNPQWKVTGSSIQTLKGDYVIPFNRLLETTERGTKLFYDWPVHLAEKTWVNLRLFREAFEKALELSKSKVDSDLLNNSFNKAQQLRTTSDLPYTEHSVETNGRKFSFRFSSLSDIANKR